MKNHSNKILCAVAFLALGFNALATTIYDDAAQYNTNQLQVANSLTIGNQISIANGVWNLTNFSIEYYTSNATLNAGVGVDVQFFKNDGPLTNGFASPGTLFFDSGWFYNTLANNLPGGGAHTINYNSTDFTGSPVPLSTGLAGNKMPGTFTFAITFANLGTNTIDLPLANDQAGVSFGDYWLYNNLSSQWTLMTNANTAANFVVDFSGVVPEPSILGLGALGGLMFFGAVRWKRKR